MRASCRRWARKVDFLAPDRVRATAGGAAIAAVIRCPRRRCKTEGVDGRVDRA